VPLPGHQPLVVWRVEGMRERVWPSGGSPRPPGAVDPDRRVRGRREVRGRGARPGRVHWLAGRPPRLRVGWRHGSRVSTGIASRAEILLTDILADPTGYRFPPPSSPRLASSISYFYFAAPSDQEGTWGPVSGVRPHRRSARSVRGGPPRRRPQLEACALAAASAAGTPAEGGQCATAAPAPSAAGAAVARRHG
jgi:hypothetical protein